MRVAYSKVIIFVTCCITLPLSVRSVDEFSLNSVKYFCQKFNYSYSNFCPFIIAAISCVSTSKSSSQRNESKQYGARVEWKVIACEKATSWEQKHRNVLRPKFLCLSEFSSSSDEFRVILIKLNGPWNTSEWFRFLKLYNFAVPFEALWLINYSVFVCLCVGCYLLLSSEYIRNKCFVHTLSHPLPKVNWTFETLINCCRFIFLLDSWITERRSLIRNGRSRIIEWRRSSVSYFVNPHTHTQCSA